MAGRRHWMKSTGVGAAAAALLLAGLVTATLGGESLAAHRSAAPVDGTRAHGADGRSGRVTGGTTVAQPVGSVAGASPAAGKGKALAPIGAFTESGAHGVTDLARLQSWLGGTTVRVAHTYLPGGGWDTIEGGGPLLEPWAKWKRAAPGRMFVLNVPMQERNEEHLSDNEVRVLIRAGAQGAFDAHFRRLAERLVGLGVPDTVIVLGWEMNGTTYTGRCGPDPDGWKTYWHRIVTAMRAVPGQHFRFDFAPNRGQDAIPWTECYPGDGNVDVIGMDSYDQPAGESFDEQVTEPYGLQAQVDFAAAHKKPVSYPEWGLSRNGDNPTYMSQMLSWIAAHPPLYQTITDYCPHGVRQCRDNPRASSVYRTLMYARKTALPAAPAGKATAKPSATTAHKPSATTAHKPTAAAAAPAQNGEPFGAPESSCAPGEFGAGTPLPYVPDDLCFMLRPQDAASG
jgi:beta-mannanase